MAPSLPLKVFSETTSNAEDHIATSDYRIRRISPTPPEGRSNLIFSQCLLLGIQKLTMKSNEGKAEVFGRPTKSRVVFSRHINRGLGRDGGSF